MHLLHAHVEYPNKFFLKHQLYTHKLSISYVPITYPCVIHNSYFHKHKLCINKSSVSYAAITFLCGIPKSYFHSTNYITINHRFHMHPLHAFVEYSNHIFHKHQLHNHKLSTSYVPITPLTYPCGILK